AIELLALFNWLWQPSKGKAIAHSTGGESDDAILGQLVARGARALVWNGSGSFPRRNWTCCEDAVQSIGVVELIFGAFSAAYWGHAEMLRSVPGAGPRGAACPPVKELSARYSQLDAEGLQKCSERAEKADDARGARGGVPLGPLEALKGIFLHRLFRGRDGGGAGDWSALLGQRPRAMFAMFPRRGELAGQRMATALESYMCFYEVFKTAGLKARPPWDAAAEAATELASRAGAAMPREEELANQLIRVIRESASALTFAVECPDNECKGVCTSSVVDKLLELSREDGSSLSPWRPIWIDGMARASEGMAALIDWGAAAALGLKGERGARPLGALACPFEKVVEMKAAAARVVALPERVDMIVAEAATFVEDSSPWLYQEFSVDAEIFVAGPRSEDASQSGGARSVRRGVLQGPCREKWSGSLADGALEEIAAAVKSALLVLKANAEREKEGHRTCEDIQLSHSDGAPMVCIIKHKGKGAKLKTALAMAVPGSVCVMAAARGMVLAVATLRAETVVGGAAAAAHEGRAADEARWTPASSAAHPDVASGPLLDIGGPPAGRACEGAGSKAARAAWGRPLLWRQLGLLNHPLQQGLLCRRRRGPAPGSRCSSAPAPGRVAAAAAGVALAGAGPQATLGPGGAAAPAGPGSVGGGPLRFGPGEGVRGAGALSQNPIALALPGLPAVQSKAMLLASRSALVKQTSWGMLLPPLALILLGGGRLIPMPDQGAPVRAMFTLCQWPDSAGRFGRRAIRARRHGHTVRQERAGPLFERGRSIPQGDDKLRGRHGGVWSCCTDGADGDAALAAGAVFHPPDGPEHIR
ncbi:unnamed protein product, partial [Prorocentrum cordatum]